MHALIGMPLVVYGIHYHLFQVSCLKQNTHVTNQLSYFSAAAAAAAAATAAAAAAAAAIFLSREYLYFRTTNLKRSC